MSKVVIVGGGAAATGAGERVATTGAGEELGLLQHKRECGEQTTDRG